MRAKSGKLDFSLSQTHFYRYSQNAMFSTLRVTESQFQLILTHSSMSICGGFITNAQNFKTETLFEWLRFWSNEARREMHTKEKKHERDFCSVDCEKFI
jgi:hypothetical protein